MNKYDKIYSVERDMISVEVHYYNKPKPNKSKTDFFVYTLFRVIGHANNGTHEDNIKVCAGVTTCVMGIRRLVEDDVYSVKYDKGLFEITLRVNVLKGNGYYVPLDLNYALNTLLCQLYDLWRLYPTQFKKFDMCEVKENEVLYARNQTEPKPFRKRKKLGFPSSDENSSC